MEFVVEKAPFLAIAERVLKCVERRDNIPVLTTFKIEAVEGRTRITGTNLDTAARGEVAAEVKTTGSCCIPADLLVRSVKQSSGTEVRVTSAEKQATVSIGRARFRLNILRADDFPDAGMISAEGSHSFPLTEGLVERVAKEVATAASTDPTRLYLCGVFINATDTGLDFVATDAMMLSKLTVEKPETLADFSGVIVPTKALSLASGASKAIVSDHFIRFEADGYAVASKLVDGAFPPYQRILLGFDTADKSAVVDRKEFAAALDRISPFGEGGQSNAIALRVSDGEMRIEGAGIQGEATDAIAVDGDATFEIGVSNRVIGPLVHGFACDTICLSVADARTPIVITDPVDDGRYALAWPYALRQPLAVAA